MELFFLGRGAAFNPKEGNNSAYFVENNQLFLIDCGESIFERLVESGVLESVEAINLMITHTHSDHIGSLGSLAMYSFYTLHKPLNIILPENAKHLPNIEKILSELDAQEMSELLDGIDAQQDMLLSARIKQKALPQLVEKMSERGVIVCEHEKECVLPKEIGGFEISKILRHGTVSVTIYRRKTEDSEVDDEE